MFPMITSRAYWADRAMHTFRYKLALVGILCASAASAQTPQPPVQLSIEYYQQRILETDARAAALTYENARLKQQVDMLTKQLADERAKADKPKTPDLNKKP